MYLVLNTSTDKLAYNFYGTPPLVSHLIRDVTIGPIDTQDTSKGLTEKFWATYAIGDDLILEDLITNVTTTILNEPLGLQYVALAFDQNANDVFAYITSTNALKLRYFDAQTSTDIVLNLGTATQMLMTMDMKYLPSSLDSDILIFYIRSGAIYYRVQRDKYATEYITPITSGATTLESSGMRRDYRFQVVYS